MRRFFLAALLVLALPHLAFSQIGQFSQASEIVPMSQSVDAELKILMASGRLMLMSGADDLVEARFSYTDGEQPSVMTDVEGRSTSVTLRGRGAAENWTIYVTDQIPITLSVDLDSGSQQLLLESIDLEELEVSMGKGESQISLPGSFPHLGEVEIKQTAGPLNVEMPGDYPTLKGLSVTGRDGPITLGITGQISELNNLQLKNGSAPTALALTGEMKTLQRVVITAKSGSIQLDLRGKWQEDCRIDVETSSGSVCIELPESVGVIARPSTASGTVKVKGLEPLESTSSSSETGRRPYRGGAFLESQGEALVNSAYGKSRVTLTVYIGTTTGNIDLVGPSKDS